MINRMHELMTKFVGRPVVLLLLSGDEVQGKLVKLDQGIAELSRDYDDDEEEREHAAGEGKPDLEEPHIYARIDQVAAVIISVERR